MKYIIAAILLVIFVNVFNVPTFIRNNQINFFNNSTYASDTGVQLAAANPTPIASPSAAPSETPTPIASPSAAPSETPTPTSGEKTTNNAAGQNKPAPTPTIIIPHPSYPAIITPFVQATKNVLDTSYKPIAPSGIVQILNLQDFYIGGQYAPIIKFILILLAILLFVIGLILIDKSRLPFIHEIKNKISFRNKKLEGTYI